MTVRLFGAVAYGLAAVCAAVVAVLAGAAADGGVFGGFGALFSGEAFGALEPETWRALRESAPLACVIGAAIGYGVTQRWPRRPFNAVVFAVLSAVVTFVFFFAVYLFGEAVITAWRGEPVGPAIAQATQRLFERAPIAFLAAMATFSAAGLLLWGLAAVGRGVRRWARRRAERPSGRKAAQERS